MKRNKRIGPGLDNYGRNPIDFSEIEDLFSNAIEKKKEPEKNICPLCKSENTAEQATYDNNGIIGPGCRSWKTSSYWVCIDCGIMFQPVKTKTEK